MCGRYVSPAESDLERFWNVRGTGDLFKAQYNVAPTMQVPIIYHSKRDDEQRVMLARWGLIPNWWKNAKAPGHTFNARLEEARDKPMWRQSFRTARCIVPAVGWYEWQERERVDVGTGEVRKYKQPYFMHNKSGPIGFAGLMSWAKGEGDEWTASCSILTTAAEGAPASIHHRMPVVLTKEAHDAWIDPAQTDPDAVQAIIEQHQLRAVELHPVSTKVNASRIDDATLIEPINPE